MSKTIKLLECIRQGKIGGGESHLLSLVENLDKTRYSPIVLSFTDGPMISRLQEMGIQANVIHTEKPFDFTRWRQVKDLMQRERIEMVHAHGTRACSNVLWAAHALRIPVVYTVHGWSFHLDQNPFLQRIRVWGEKYLTSRTSVNISVSASNKQTGVEYLGRFDSVIINNGIDRKKFNPGRSFKTIREELGIPAEAVLVLFIARFTAHKQPLTLISAFSEALKQMPDMYMLMVGDGDQREQGMEMLSASGMGDRILLQPFRDDVPDILAAADMFVLPSLWEGLPIGLLEAMAMGKAVIATNVDGTKEVVQDGVNGLLIEPGNIPVLTQALVDLGRDAGRRTVFGENAREAVRLRFDAAGMTRQIEAVYDDVLRKNN